ncbi:polysaccharide biosynthesis protein [Phocaeicola sp.]
MNIFNKLTNWYFSKKSLPYWCIFIIDCCIVVFSGLVAYTLGHGALVTVERFWSLLATLLVYLFFYIIGFRVFHTYSGVIRYSSFVDLQRVGFAMILGSVLVGVVKSLFPLDSVLVYLGMRDLVFIVLLATCVMWTVRVMVKYMYDMHYHNELAQHIFILGTREGGVSLAKSIRNQGSSSFFLCGFVSDEPDMLNRRLLGTKIYPLDKNLVSLMKKKGVEGLLVSPLQSENFRSNDAFINELTTAGIRIYMMPSAQEWDGKSNLSHTQLKEVDIEDLLPRDKIEVDMDAVGKLLTGKKILITGAAGSIGSEMVRQIAIYHPSELILIDQAETPLHDIRLYMARQWPDIKAWTLVAGISNLTRMEEIFREHRPDYVFHAAAYKHVPMMEDNPSESVQNNIWGTRIVADLSVKYGTKKFVMISTDKAVNPTNVMGCSKRICEIYVQSLDKAIKEGKLEGITQFVTTRFGNVLGSNGSVIPLFKEQIKRGGPVTVTDPEIIRFFMLIPEACKLVLEAGTMGKGGEIFVFDMGKPVKIADLAKRMILLSGAKNVEIKYTGLRAGEKLYEEVLNDKEVTKETFHPKIKIAQVREYDYSDACNQLEALKKVSYSYDDMAIVKVMKEIVPEFKSRHSKYEVLDKRENTEE